MSSDSTLVQAPVITDAATTTEAATAPAEVSEAALAVTVDDKASVGDAAAAAAEHPPMEAGHAPELPKDGAALAVLAATAEEVREEAMMSPAELDDDEEEGEAEMMGMRLGALSIAKAATQAKESRFTQHGSMYVPRKEPAAAASAVAAKVSAPAAAPATVSAPAPAVSYDGSKHSLEDLKASKADGSGPLKDINFSAKELYLADDVFATVFKMTPAAFAALPKWKKDEQKKKAGLF